MTNDAEQQQAASRTFGETLAFSQHPVGVPRQKYAHADNHGRRHIGGEPHGHVPVVLRKVQG